MDTAQQISLQTGHRVALMVMSLMLLGLVLELVRRDLLKERYALLWLATSVVGLVIGLFPTLIVKFSLLLRFQMLTALYVVSFVFVLGIVLGFSVAISRLGERNRELTQELALLENRVGKLKSKEGGHKK